MTTKTTTFLCACFCLFIIACNNNYKGENYTAFDSMDELVHEIVQSIKENDEPQMLQLMNNDALLFDLLNNATGTDAQKTKAYLGTEEGKRNFEISQSSKKQRINAFFTTGLPTQITINKAAFRTSGFALQEDKPYSQGSPAHVQNYQIVLDNGNSESYTYDIEVIYWYDKYHLVEAAGFLNKQ